MSSPGLIPRIPAILLLCVVGLWACGRWTWNELDEAMHLSLIGPTIALDRDSRGEWELDWPEWPSAKGPPVIIAGVSPAEAQANLSLRVRPPDAVTPESGTRSDADGWFPIRGDYVYQDLVRLDPARARRIEYRVVGAPSSSKAEASLSIVGLDDSSIYDGALMTLRYVDQFAMICGAPLCLWLVIGVVRRRRMGTSGLLARA